MKKHITLLELQQLISNKVAILILDVRSKEEFEEKHIPFAVNFPIELIEVGKYSFEKNKMSITVCSKGGGRSERAATFLRDNTQTEVYFLEGGTLAWFQNII